MTLLCSKVLMVEVAHRIAPAACSVVWNEGEESYRSVITPYRFRVEFRRLQFTRAHLTSLQRQSSWHLQRRRWERTRPAVLLPRRIERWVFSTALILTHYNNTEVCGPVVRSNLLSSLCFSFMEDQKTHSRSAVFLPRGWHDNLRR